MVNMAAANRTVVGVKLSPLCFTIGLYLGVIVAFVACILLHYFAVSSVMASSSVKSVGEPFNRQMRKATRDIHAISDALVNSKLAFALSDSSVWAEGLLVFYEIFRYLEEAMERLKGTSVAELSIDGMQRTEAFEKDLAFYLGENWKASYTPRESVANYLLHLMRIEESDPDLLIAYVYHLYMGLLSGGQILRKKRQLISQLPFLSRSEVKGGNAVTSFGKFSIYKLKKDLIATLNSTAETLDEETRKRILDESRVVFQLNNTLIQSVRGTWQVLLHKALLVFFVIFILYLAYYYLYYRK